MGTMAAVIRSTGIITGLITANVVDEDDCDEKGMLPSFSFSQRKLAYILTLGVNAEHRQNGLGRQLLKALREYLETCVCTCQAIYLHCLRTNEPALLFYSRLLFEQVA